MTPDSPGYSAERVTFALFLSQLLMRCEVCHCC